MVGMDRRRPTMAESIAARIPACRVGGRGLLERTDRKAAGSRLIDWSGRNPRITGEQFPEMFLHRADLAGASGGGPLKLRAAVEKPVNRTLPRYLAACPEESTGAGGKLVNRCSAIGHNQWNAARPSFGRDHAEGLRLTAVDERIGARDQAREIRAICNWRQHCNLPGAACEQFETEALGAIAYQHHANGTAAAHFTHRAQNHVPALLR